jgi:hypothetical protein
MPTPNSSTRLATATRVASKSDRDGHTATSAVATSINASVNVCARNLHQDTDDLDLGMNPGISPGMMTEVSSTRRLAVRSRPMRRAVKRPPSPRKFRARPGSKTLTLNLQCRRQCGSAECSRTATQTQTSVMMAHLWRKHAGWSLFPSIYLVSYIDQHICNTPPVIFCLLKMYDWRHESSAEDLLMMVSTCQGH